MGTIIKYIIITILVMAITRLAIRVLNLIILGRATWHFSRRLSAYSVESLTRGPLVLTPSQSTIETWWWSEKSPAILQDEWYSTKRHLRKIKWNKAVVVPIRASLRQVLMAAWKDFQRISVCWRKKWREEMLEVHRPSVRLKTHLRRDMLLQVIINHPYWNGVGV